MSRGACVLSAVVLCGCGGHSATVPSSPTPVPGVSASLFTASPLELSSIARIVPLGNLNPPGHTLPTDHIYINNRGFTDPPVPRQPVFAPGDGLIQFILRNGVEAKIGIRSGTWTYYLDHVELDAEVREGATLTAGQRLGTTGVIGYGIDLGVFSDQITVPFLSPARYSAESLHGDSPLKYFAEPVRGQLYARVIRIGDKDGAFNFDTPGRLAGNWFLEGLSPAVSASPAAWPQHLAFVYDNYDPSSVRVSIGGTLALVGAFAVQSGAPDPRGISMADGRITYRLLLAPPEGQPAGPQLGLMLVDMLAADRIRAEVLVGSALTGGAFTGAAQIYVR